MPSSHLEDLMRAFLERPPALHPSVDAEDPRTSNAVQSELANAVCVHRREGAPISSPLSGTHHSPYFGYPVLHGTPIPTLRHGRRRKRDLLRTLAWLFWARWHKPIGAAMAAVAFVTIYMMSQQLRLSFKTQGRSLKTNLREFIRQC